VLGLSSASCQNSNFVIATEKHRKSVGKFVGKFAASSRYSPTLTRRRYLPLTIHLILLCFSGGSGK
jgi:hypothetical protein